MLTKMSDSLWSSIPYSNVEFAISEINDWIQTLFLWILKNRILKFQRYNRIQYQKFVRNQQIAIKFSANFLEKSLFKNEYFFNPISIYWV